MGNGNNQCLCKKNKNNKYLCGIDCVNANKPCKQNGDCVIDASPDNDPNRLFKAITLIIVSYYIFRYISK